MVDCNPSSTSLTLASIKGWKVWIVWSKEAAGYKNEDKGQRGHTEGRAHTVLATLVAFGVPCSSLRPNPFRS